MLSHTRKIDGLVPSAYIYSDGIMAATHIRNCTVESMEAKINRYTRKWLGLTLGLSDVAFVTAN